MKYNEKKNILIRFYRSLNFKGFRTINDEKLRELDELVLKWYNVFHPSGIKEMDLAAFIAVKLILDPSSYGVLTGDEIAYFFIKMIDPDLLLLECYEAANTKKEFKEFSLINLGYCDGRLLFLEKYFNEYFKLFNKDEIWSLERIKRDN